MDARRVIGHIFCFLSRTAGWLATGRWEMFCARAHWNGRRELARRLDWAFFLLRGEIDHCRNMAHWEERQAAARRSVGVVDQLRRAAGL